MVADGSYLPIFSHRLHPLVVNAKAHHTSSVSVALSDAFLQTLSSDIVKQLMSNSIFQNIAIGAGVTLSALMMTATQASAFTYALGSASQSTNSTATGASASVDFDFFDTSKAGQVELRLKFANTTGTLSTGTFGSGATDAKLTGIAFDLFDDISIAGSPSLNGKLGSFLTNVNFSGVSNKVGNFSVGFADGKNFLGGNANGALKVGETSFATLLLNSNKNAADLQNQFQLALASEKLNIAARFMQVDAGAGSDKLWGGTVSNPIAPTPSVPPTPPTLNLSEPIITPTPNPPEPVISLPTPSVPEPTSSEPTSIPEPAALLGLGVLAGYLKKRHQPTSGKAGLA